MKTYGSNSAYPFTETNPEEAGQQVGLTKREYFAALAMQGILADTADRGVVYVAESAVKFADALINALNKQ